MKVSIIIPTFNRANLISYTLDSIFEPKDIDLEVIVVDDGSTDGTEEIVRSKYPAVRFIKQKNQGAPAARNLGLKESTGGFILFLDSDDILEGDFFGSRVKEFDLNHTLDCVYGNFDFFSGEYAYKFENEVPRTLNYPLYSIGNEDRILYNLLAGWYIHPCSILWKRSFIEKIEGFRLDLLINQDVDLLFRAILANGNITGVSGGRALIREHGNERVGAIEKNPLKINQIFQLRVKFKEMMIQNDIWNQSYSDSMAYYCFEIWSIYRISMPTEAKKFLIFSRVLNPNLKLKGRFILRFFAEIFGNERAVVFRQFLSG
ncbi:glycosyltransferase family 2 protein [Algoriphagus sp.]|uniref:glycosyltransferase family 2 protein n=1 Tax=Algoriphagus sp. TaxID=1872435 RepID=UPI00391BF2DE